MWKRTVYVCACLCILDRIYADNDPSVIGRLSVDNISRALVKDTVNLSK